MTEPEAARARNAPRLAILAAAFLVVLKGVGAWVTGSLALGSAALDSLIDLFVSAANWVVLRRSAAPPDAEHAYGHGKFENLAALGQGLLLAGGAVSLMWSAVGRLRSGEPPRETGVGIAVLVVSLAVSYYVARHLRRAARAADSPALEADSRHYASDLWVNGAAALALVVIAVTGWAAADSLVALGVALYVLRTAATLVLEALGVLSDRALPEDELRRIQEVVASFRE
ncbi:MAG TPA: cation diffusion facilitator family transporter, partial [Thermoanaerobaculia bacterium]|nr:cation diffusion facilitator family transporter [Thermoanaerobaculia bacterium]